MLEMEALQGEITCF